MGISRLELIDPDVLRHTENSFEMKCDEKPSDWVKRVTGKKPNKRR